MKNVKFSLRLAATLFISCTLFIACQKNDPNDLSVINNTTQSARLASGDEAVKTNPRMERITPMCSSTYDGIAFPINDPRLGVSIQIDSMGYHFYPPSLYTYKYEFRKAGTVAVVYTATSNTQISNITWSGIQTSTTYNVQFFAIDKTNSNSITNGGSNSFTTLSSCSSGTPTN